MRSFTIYNEKGGMGKTTISTLAASYLAYCRGLRVCVLDFDCPTFHFRDIRRDENRLMQDPKTPLAVYTQKNPIGHAPYDIYPVPTGKDGVHHPEEVLSFMTQACSDGYDILIYDFPGRFSEDEAISLLAANGLIGFAAIPMDRDIQSRRSALIIADALQQCSVPCSVFWNRLSAGSREQLDRKIQQWQEPFIRHGIHVMESILSDCKSICRESSEQMFLRSTLCFPQRYLELRFPSLNPFLEELTTLIDNSSDNILL